MNIAGKQTVTRAQEEELRMVWDRHTNVWAQVCVRMCVSTAVRQMGESLTTLIPQLFLLLFQLSHTVCKTTFNFCFCNFSVLTPSATRRYHTTPKHSTPHNTTAPTHIHCPTKSTSQTLSSTISVLLLLFFLLLVEASAAHIAYAQFTC